MIYCPKAEGEDEAHPGGAAAWPCAPLLHSQAAAPASPADAPPASPLAREPRWQQAWAGTGGLHYQVSPLCWSSSGHWQVSGGLFGSGEHWNLCSPAFSQFSVEIY